MIRKWFAVFIVASVLSAGCGGRSEDNDSGFGRIFEGSFFSIGLPDGFEGVSNTEGAVLKGSFSVKITGFRSPGSKPGELPKDTDRISQEGITLGNFETDDINGHKAFILDSKYLIAAIFPLSGKVVMVIFTNSNSPDFERVAPKMLGSFKITSVDGISDAFSGRPVAPRVPDEDASQDKAKKVEYSPKTPSKPNKAGLAIGQYFESDMLFFELRPFFIVKSKSDTAINVIGMLEDKKDNQTISIFITQPVPYSSREFAMQFAGGSNPEPVKLGNNTFQKISSLKSDGFELIHLFYSTSDYACKIILDGPLGLEGYAKEIIGTLVFK